MNADGKTQLNVTDNEDIGDFDPSWTPDGRILFTSERAATLGIEAADVRRRSSRVRSHGWSAPNCSPNGRPTAHVSPSCRRGTSDHTSTSTAVQGGRPRQLTKDPRFDDAYPTWSRDGRRIAFVREDEFGAEFLYTMNADGTDLRFLLEAGDLCCPEWSPDGTRLAIALDSAIVVVDRNGRGRRLVTQAGSNSSPTWSPDGRWIAFASDRDDEDDADIFVVAATGGPARQLTDNDDEDVWPDWSPDGGLIAFSRGDLDELESSIYLMRPDGKGPRRLPLEAPAAMPSWQPLP